MEYINAMLDKLGLVPAEWYTTLNSTQKAIFLGLLFLVLVQLIQNLLYWYIRWRDRNVVNVEKEDAELKMKFGEECHDVLVNWVKDQKLTQKQYRMFCRLLRTVFPGALYGGTYSDRLRRVFKTRQTKLSISQRLLNGFYNPTQGWLNFLKKSQAVKISKFNRNK
jgi:hypothetical protein